MFHAQAKRLPRAAAAQLHKGQIGAAFHAVGNSGGGLFGGFALALHTAAAQTVGIGFELAPLHAAVRGVGGCGPQVGHLGVVAHAFEPVLGHQPLQRLRRAVQAQHRAQGAA